MPDDDSERRRSEKGQRGQGWRPVPDPTTLTTEALQREIKILNDVIVERLKGMDDLMDEKFKGVEKEFALVERQRVEQKADAKEALGAALLSAQEAVREQTQAARKDIDSLGERVDTALSGLSNQLGTLTGRITVMEAIKLGTQETRQGTSQNAGLIYGGIGALLAIISFILVIGDVLTP